MTSLPPSIVTRLEKVANDNGFDLDLPAEPGWLSFASTQAPLRIWLTVAEEDQFFVALSQSNVARSLNSEQTVDGNSSWPLGAQGAVAAADIPTLHRIVRRAFQLSKSLPDELLHAFERRIAALPRTTEADRLVVQRVGQELFREGLIEYWDGRCAITGLSVVTLLRASHIKPWAACASDAERLDVFNGFLLGPNLDAVFDCGFVTIADDGAVLLSAALSLKDRIVLGLADRSFRVARLEDGHRRYLRFHREHVFRNRDE